MTEIILYSLSLILLFISFIKNKEKAIKISLKSFENIMPQFLVVIITIAILLSII